MSDNSRQILNFIYDFADNNNCEIAVLEADKSKKTNKTRQYQKAAEPHRQLSTNNYQLSTWVF